MDASSDTQSKPSHSKPWARALTIGKTFVRYRLHELLPDNLPLTWRVLLAPLKLLPAHPASQGQRLCSACEELGPVFVKFGQMLSTRRDLLPLQLADDLRVLQDQVTPFPSDQAQALIERALGGPVSEFFSEFDAKPLASASVAQVHPARLLSGEEVVIKIIRPDIEPSIRADIAVMYALARQVQGLSAELKRLHPVAVVADYERTIMDELNLEHEAANTVQLRHNFAESELLYVPQIHPEFCRPNLMVMERIGGIPIGNIAELHAQNINLPLLAERGVETFFTQVFEHNFFHADMHPGNIFVDASNPNKPSYIAIDCAIIGSLTEKDQDYLARNLLAFFNRDYAAVARLHLDSGWIPADTDPAAFEAVIRRVCDPIFAKPLSEISFGEFLVELFQTAAEFKMEVQPQLVLLQKTLLYIEGLGRQLYPQLDLWETGKPFIERWMEQRLSPATAMNKLIAAAPQIAEQLPILPEVLASAPARLNRFEHRLAEQQTQLNALQSQQRSATTKLARVGGITLVVLGSILLLRATGLDSDNPLAWAGIISTGLGAMFLARLL